MPLRVPPKKEGICLVHLNGTDANGISGNNIVGDYFDGSRYHGFLYDGSSYTTLNVPGANATWAYGISGNEIVGYYGNAGHNQGFVAFPVPEPKGLALLVLGAAALPIRRRQQRN